MNNFAKNLNFLEIFHHVEFQVEKKNYLTIKKREKREEVYPVKFLRQNIKKDGKYKKVDFSFNVRIKMLCKKKI